MKQMLHCAGIGVIGVLVVAAGLVVMLVLPSFIAWAPVPTTRNPDLTWTGGLLRGALVVWLFVASFCCALKRGWLN